MSAPQTLAPSHRWTVKQVQSDCVTLIDKPKGGPPPTVTINFANINVPKLGKPKTKKDLEDSKDEPWAWEAREFLRKKLVGEEVYFEIFNKVNTKDYGVIYFGKDKASAENITESLISQGLATVREGKSTPEHDRLVALENDAKAAGVGRWSGDDPKTHIRDVKYISENTQNFLDKHGKSPIQAIIEYVKDGSTVKALLLPDFYHIQLMMSGIKCPQVAPKSDQAPAPPTNDFGEEAKFFVERRLLQRDVEVILESASNTCLVGTIRHPKGNIAEALLKEGFAQCIGWSITVVTTGADKLLAAERYAKENRVRRWKNWQPQTPQVTGKEKEFQGTVVEVIGGDALMIKYGNGPPQKYFLASLRPPRPEERPSEDGKPPQAKPKPSRQLYDVPWLFEAREFLRKKLVGRKVNVVVDYIQPPRESLPQKKCCTVTINGVNVAEAMISKGLGTVVTYRSDDDKRSSHFDELLAAETKAKKSSKGVHGKKDGPQHRVTDLSSDVNRAKQFSNSLKRLGRTEAVVEFVASGSRLRLYLPKDASLITFLLAGINCPRGSRPNVGGNGMIEGEEYGEEALQFTRDKCLQHEVDIYVDSVDRGGNFIGWLFYESTPGSGTKTVNLSEALVREGLASVHFSAEKTEYYKALKEAEDGAKARREKLWKNYVEVEKEDKMEEEVVTERKIDYQNVYVVEATKELKFYAQYVDQGGKLEALMNEIRQEFQTNAPLPGAYTPKRGDLCAAKFTEDNEWYRARVEKVAGGEVHVYFIDYGNREITNSSRCASLPSSFTADKSFAHEYNLAYVKLPNDNDYQETAVTEFKNDVENRTFLLNVEYRIDKSVYASLSNPKTKDDVGQSLVKDGFLLVDETRKKRNPKVLSEYLSAQNEAKRNRLNIWIYGDITEDDSKEFGR